MKNKIKIFFVVAITCLFFSFNEVSAQPIAPPTVDEQLGEIATIYGLSQKEIPVILSNVLFWVLGVFSMLCIIGFVISGIMYLTSAGDEKKSEDAKNMMKWAIIGTIVGFGSFVIINAINLALSGSYIF